MNRIQWIGYQTIMRREVVRIFRIWPQTLMPPVISMTLYFLIFGAFIGPRVGTIDGVSYMAFLVPGLVMMQVVINAYMNVVSTVFSAKFQKSFEELLVSPLSPTTILMGYVSGGIIRGILVGGSVTVVALFFTPLQVQHAVLLFFTVILTAFLFSFAGFINAIFAKKFDDISIIPTFVLTPLIYLGGVFYSIKLLPEFWQQLSLANPILYLVNLFRYGFHGVSDIEIYKSFVALLVMVMVLWAICHNLLKRGIGFLK